MCGIVAAAAGSNIVPVLVEGLKRLEYRGYDSAGLAVISGQGIERVRSVGRVAELEIASAGTQAVTQHGVVLSKKDAHARPLDWWRARCATEPLVERQPCLPRCAESGVCA